VGERASGSDSTHFAAKPVLSERLNPQVLAKPCGARYQMAGAFSALPDTPHGPPQ
jgi:hypothetical protein